MVAPMPAGQTGTDEIAADGIGTAQETGKGIAGVLATVFRPDAEQELRPSIDTPTTSTGVRKVLALDGLRGVACLLVLFGHAWIIVPSDVIDSTGIVQGLFASGSLGVTIFLALGGFLVTRSILGQLHRTGAMSIGRFWLRRLIRIGSQLIPFLAVIAIVAAFDRWDAYTAEQTRNSLLNAARFTLNWAFINDAFNTRQDFGHLWYLSVEQQVYLVLVIALAWLVRYRVALILLVTAGAVASMAYRWVVLDRDGWFIASLRTFTRSDALLLGAAVALAFPYLAKHAANLRVVVLPALLAMTGTVLLSSELSDVAFLQTQGIVFVIATTALVVSIAAASNPTGLGERFLSWPPFRFIGKVSFPLYIWHYPAFYAADRWANDVAWMPRLLITLAALALIVGICQIAIEQPVGRWLDRNRKAPNPVAASATVAVDNDANAGTAGTAPA